MESAGLWPYRHNSITSAVSVVTRYRYHQQASQVFLNELHSFYFTNNYINALEISSYCATVTMYIAVNCSIGKVLEKDWWENNVVDVLSSGFVIWAPGDRIDTSCELKLTYFPYDTQLCMIVVGTVSSTSAKVNLESTTGYIDLKYFQRNGEWIVVGNKTDSVQVPLLTTTGKNMIFSRVVFKLLLRRRSGYYFINIIIPCVVLSLISALVFKVPVESGEKISLSITVLLSFSVFLLVIASGIPKISTTVSLFGTYTPT